MLLPLFVAYVDELARSLQSGSKLSILELLDEAPSVGLDCLTLP